MTWKNEYNTNRQTYLTQKQRERRQKLKSDNSNNQYYQAHNIKILLSLKEYTELNKETKKLWLDFAKALKNLAHEGIADITEIQELAKLAQNLVNDYYEQGKKEVQRGKFWNSLTEAQQTKLIKFWAKEKVRQDKNLLTELEQQERQSKQYQQEIELQKFHEQKGIENCLKGNSPCYSCEEIANIHKEIKQKVFGYSKERKSTNKEQCPDCGKYVKELNKEHGICAKCVKNYEE